MLSGCAGGGSNNAGPGTATPTPSLTPVPLSSMPKTYGDINDLSYILDNLRYIRINNTNYVDDQHYTMILTISNDPATYKGKSCNHLVFKGNVTDAKGQDAIDAGKGLNFSIELYAALSHGNISDVYGGHIFFTLLGQPQEMDIPEGDKSINLADMIKQGMAVPMGEEKLFAGINSIPLNYTGTDVVTIGKNNYTCYVLDLLMAPQKVQEEDVVIVESHRINATSFNVTYDSGETEVISLVDDGTIRYWWYPPLAGYPLRVDISGGNMRAIQNVEEWR